ncbi:hypothetical protein [Stagnihabitans tardus]|uniref:Uncharacterized protein n=1 Tax=Stagnihabitans tardus TaxID=2699202 RepID=A0AAE4YD25_9RHOB|nr:hypothetical protein [Stagnihabitans tardus]NBZ89216.1 hypothetical protein [Stagnihabitans tardus]
MDLTTGALLRRILATPLSMGAHKLATLLLDGMAWKEGYNGLARGTAAFTTRQLMQGMGISRQHLRTLLTELAQSDLRLERWKDHGHFAPWIFRFNPVDNSDTGDDGLTSRDAKSPLLESHHKTVFAGFIEIDGECPSQPAAWLALIDAAKRALPCAGVAASTIWERFLTFNRAKGKTTVPAGFLLGFMRKWKVCRVKEMPEAAALIAENPAHAAATQDLEALHLAALAPVGNWQFHQADLLRQIGADRYEDRIRVLMDRLGVKRFAAMLAVHGQAVAHGELSA